MRRTALLSDVLAEFTASSSVPSALPQASPTDDAFVHALRSLEHFIRAEYEEMTDPAVTALRLAKDPDDLALSRAVAGFAVAGWSDAVTNPELRDPITGGDPLHAAADDQAHLSGALRLPLLHLLAESALACARIDLAAFFLERSGPVPDTLFGAPNPYLTVMRGLHIRVNLFQGQVGAALKLVHTAIESAHTPVESLFTSAVACLVEGNSDDRRSAKELADRIESSGIDPVSAVTRGCYLLAAYGLVAAGNGARAAKFILDAGGDPALDHFMIIDRVLGLELLASSAITAGDLDAAEAWLARARPLHEHPIAASTVARIESRVALLAGDSARAVEMAEQAIEFARADDRLIEAAEGEILLARARIAATRRGEAAKRLEDVVTDAVEHGHHSVRRSAARELREVGRRLRPTASSGLKGLSAREIDVAHRMAIGLSNSAIARELFLSEHTVRIHVSRVLHAFGVATRIGVATAVATSSPSTVEAETPLPPPPLTIRQNEIVHLIVSGATNADIARALGVGVKTVEKHVTDILHRWNAQSRVGIARIALADSAHSPVAE